MRNLVLAVSAAAVAVPVTMAFPTEEAQAQRRYYDRNGYYNGPTWRGRDGRYRCRRSNGTTGLLIGGAAGALIGREIDGGRNRTTGTVVGAVAGALIGREVQRSSRRGRRCR
ncbi:MAG: glycine zipper 2TM domain-containing protein [Sphingomonas sp.]